MIYMLVVSKKDFKMAGSNLIKDLMKKVDNNHEQIGNLRVKT